MSNDNGGGQTLVIWFKNAETAYFSSVMEFCEGTHEIAFTYFGKESEVRRDALFDRREIAGYALEVSE